MLTALFSTRNRKFNSYFDGISQRLNTMSRLFDAAFSNDSASLKETHIALKAEETAIASLIISLRNESGSSLISPLDREDVHFLTSDLRLISGNMLHVVAQLKKGDVQQMPEILRTVAPMVAAAISELSQILGMLKNISKLKHMTDSCHSVRQALHDCDTMIDEATADALNTIRDPFELIKITDHFSALQRLLEKAGDILNISESIIIKYS